MADDDEWERIGAELFRRGLVRPVDRCASLDGKRILNGAFGVVKPNKTTESGKEVLRFIMDFRACNSVTKIIEGDVRTLASAPALQHVVMPSGSVMRISAEDLVAAFYLFALSEEWSQLMCFEKKISWKSLGQDRPGSTWIGACVLPMGWSSAVGVMQRAHRRLALRSPFQGGAGLLPEMEVRKDMIFPILEVEGSAVWSLYLDDTNILELISKKVAKSLEGRPSDEQLRLRGVCTAPEVHEPQGRAQWRSHSFWRLWDRRRHGVCQQTQPEGSHWSGGPRGRHWKHQRNTITDWPGWGGSGLRLLCRDRWLIPGYGTCKDEGGEFGGDWDRRWLSKTSPSEMAGLPLHQWHKEPDKEGDGEIGEEDTGGDRHVAGGGRSPCQGLSKLSSMREHLADPRSALFYDLSERLKWVQEIGVELGVWTIRFCENVIGDVEDVEEMSRELAMDPTDASCISRVRRPRLYWSSSGVDDHPSFQREAGEVCDKLVFEGEVEPLQLVWDEGGWPAGEMSNEAKLPTFTRAIPRRRPPPDPAGIKQCDETTLRRWREDRMKFPPYTYLPQFLMRKVDGDETRVASANEREVLMGFRRGYTKALFKKKAEGAEQEEAQEVQRMAALGNSFHCLVMAGLLDLWLWSRKNQNGALWQCRRFLEEWHAELAKPKPQEEEAEDEGSESGLRDEETEAEEQALLPSRKMRRPEWILPLRGFYKPREGEGDESPIGSSFLEEDGVPRFGCEAGPGNLLQARCSPKNVYRPQSLVLECGSLLSVQRRRPHQCFGVCAAFCMRLNGGVELWAFTAADSCTCPTPRYVYQCWQKEDHPAERSIDYFAVLLPCAWPWTCCPCGLGSKAGLNPADEPSRRYEPSHKATSDEAWKAAWKAKDWKAGKLVNFVNVWPLSPTFSPVCKFCGKRAFMLLRRMFHSWTHYCPNTLKTFGKDGEPKSYANYTIASVQFFIPESKRQLVKSWRLVGTWNKIEVPVRATPIGPEILLGFAGLFYKWQWERAGHIAGSSIQCLPPNRGDVQDTAGTRGPADASKWMLLSSSLQDTKTSQRKQMSWEKVLIREDQALACLDRLCHNRNGPDFLVDISIYKFRKLWSDAVQELQLEGYKVSAV